MNYSTDFVESVKRQSRSPAVLKTLQNIQSVHVLNWVLSQTNVSRYLVQKSKGDGAILLDEVSDARDALVRDLQKDVANIIEAFEIPDFLLPAIAKDYIEHNSYENAIKASRFTGRALL